MKGIQCCCGRPRSYFTSISKSGRLNAVLNSEQKWAMAGTSHHDWISSTETVHPRDIFGLEKLCDARPSHQKVASSATRDVSVTLQTGQKLLLPSCCDSCHCDPRSATVCLNQSLTGAEQMGRAIPPHGEEGGGSAYSALHVKLHVAIGSVYTVKRGDLL